MGVSQISVVTMYYNSHEDQTADAESPLDPELDGDVATKPAEQALGQILAGSDKDEVFIGHCGILPRTRQLDILNLG